jgi:transposase-like protein
MSGRRTTNRRLNNAEKEEIIDLYRQTGETTLTLADRFGVSNSTIGRIVKSGLSDDEYDSLVQRKRGRGAEARAAVVEEAEIEEEVEATELEGEADEADDTAVAEWDEDEAFEKVDGDEDEALEEADDDDFDFDRDAALLGEGAEAELLEVAAEFEGLRPDLVEDEDDLDDDLEEEFDDEEYEEGEEADLSGFFGGDRQAFTVLPFADAVMPRVCYLVVDRGAELIAPPLREFGELGQMSSQEAEHRTLPIFDNHRVAKRFSNIRTQRVIKVPDSRIFYKVTHHLVAKGIDRLLVDGQVYGL